MPDDADGDGGRDEDHDRGEAVDAAAAIRGVVQPYDLPNAALAFNSEPSWQRENETNRQTALRLIEAQLP